MKRGIASLFMLALAACLPDGLPTYFEAAGNDNGNATFDLRDPKFFRIACDYFEQDEYPARALVFSGSYKAQRTSYALLFDPTYQEDKAIRTLTPKALKRLFYENASLEIPATASDPILIPYDFLQPNAGSTLSTLYVCNMLLETKT